MTSAKEEKDRRSFAHSQPRGTAPRIACKSGRINSSKKVGVEKKNKGTWLDRGARPGEKGRGALHLSNVEHVWWKNGRKAM